MESILRRIDQVLADEKYSSDIEIAGLIWTDLATVLESDLDDAQRKALNVAKAYWAGNSNEDERLTHLQMLCDRMDKFLHDGADNTRLAVLNQIVAASLMTTTGLSHELGVFVVELAQKAGVHQHSLNKIFLRHIPDYD